MMMQQRYLTSTFLIAAGLMVTASQSVMAGSPTVASSDTQVKVTVESGCAVTTAPDFDFGSVSAAPAKRFLVKKMTVNCTLGQTYKVSFQGQHDGANYSVALGDKSPPSQGIQRHMTSATTSSLIRYLIRTGGDFSGDGAVTIGNKSAANGSKYSLTPSSTDGVETIDLHVVIDREYWTNNPPAAGDYSDRVMVLFEP